MVVCACQNIDLDQIVDAVEIVGSDIEAIKNLTEAGKGCEECLDTACESVDLPLPYAIMNAEAILKQRS